MTGIVALVNIGHEVTNINILDEGVPILTRDSMVGTRKFREDLQRERGLGAEQRIPDQHPEHRALAELADVDLVDVKDAKAALQKFLADAKAGSPSIDSGQSGCATLKKKIEKSRFEI